MDLPFNLRKLSKQLFDGYVFAKAYGATPPKGPGRLEKRPIVVAPLRDRIVQRAILDVLQQESRLLGLREIINTPTSIGGIPGKGVDTAILLIDEEVGKGRVHLAGSDIASFFTKIPKSQVVEFIRSQGIDHEFVCLFESALTVELENEARLPNEDRKLFPTDEMGVAQGCPLSALAGNIVLSNFDAELNDPSRGLVCIRYIDDFLLMGRKSAQVAKGMERAREILHDLGMGIYDPATHGSKAFAGHISDGHVFLGHQLIPGSYPPSANAQLKLRRSIDELIAAGQKSIDKVCHGHALKHHDRSFADTIVAIDRTIRGWRGSFRSSSCSRTFAALDHWIARRIGDFERYLDDHAPKKGERRTRAIGVSNMDQPQLPGQSLPPLK
jgi:hypothetical protein